MSRHSPRNPLYIVVRSLQIVFCIVCLGVTGYLRFGNFITYSYYSYYDDYGWSNYPYKTKRDAMPEPMPKGGKGSSGYSSSSSSSSSYDDDDTTTKYIDPVIPLGLLIAGSIVGGMTAVASLGTQCCARRRTATAMKFFMIWDLLPVAVLFLVGMALVAAVLGQQEAWSLPGVVPNLYRGAFAGGLILFVLFTYTAVHAMHLRKRTGQPTDPILPNATAPTTPGVPPAYPNAAATGFAQEPKPEHFQPQPQSQPQSGYASPGMTGSNTTGSLYNSPQPQGYQQPGYQQQPPYSPSISPPPPQPYPPAGSPPPQQYQAPMGYQAPPPQPHQGQ